MNNNTPKFSKVYYVVQTYPIFKTCGFCFGIDAANKLAEFVRSVTGIRGRIIEFTPDELKELDFKKTGVTIYK